MRRRRRIGGTLGLAGLVVASGLVPAHGADPVGSWSAAAPMSAARYRHVATALLDGKVLVTGGGAGSAEVYDPVARSWTATGAAVVRTYNSATRLADGRVLVAGGQDARQYAAATATAELFDPTSGTMAPTGPMALARYNHTATLLDGPACHTAGATPPTFCGNVLVAGGAGPEASAELYDPEQGSWTTVASMTVPRFFHSATALADGRVLVAGGDGGGSAEIYDPAAGSWHATPPMSSGHRLHSAAPLGDGRVLVAGGDAGWPGIGDTSAELFDPDANGGAGGWSATAPMAHGRLNHSATALSGGAVLVAGGQDSSSKRHASVEIFRDGAWSEAAPLLTGRTTHTATMLDTGEVLVTGGEDGTQALASAELFSATGGPAPQVVEVAPATGPTYGGTRVSIVGTGFEQVSGVAFGGVAADSYRVESPTRISAVSPPRAAAAAVPVTVSTTSAGSSPPSPAATFVYYARTGAWSVHAGPATARTNHTATELTDGTVLVVGGRDEHNVLLNSVEVYDPTSRTWQAGPQLGDARQRHSATRLADGKVLVVGGEGIGGGFLASAAVYDPAAGGGSGAWIEVGQMTARREDHNATLLSDGRVLVNGGRNCGPSYDRITGESTCPGAEAEVYNPSSASWSPTSIPKAFRDKQSATLLADGRVLVAGGNAQPIPRCSLAENTISIVDNSCQPPILPTAEIYDPAGAPGGTWSAAGAMHATRAGHVATLLSDGRVLVAGGDRAGSAEIFSPSHTGGAWALTGTMATERAGPPASPVGAFTASLLVGPGCGASCNKVLVSGGAGTNSEALSFAELYDPATGQWEPTASLNRPRQHHTATPLVSGRVLALGGEDKPDTSVVELFDPAGGGQPTPSVISLEPPAGPTKGGTEVRLRGVGLFAPDHNLTVMFGERQATRVTFVADDEIIAVTPPSPQGRVEVRVEHAGSSGLPGRFTYAAGVWQPTGGLNTGRFMHTATALQNGDVLVAGGTRDLTFETNGLPDGVLSSAEVYNPDKAAWSAVASMAGGRFQHTATVLSGPRCRREGFPPTCGMVLVVGGQVPGGAATAGVELYDPLADRWLSTAAMSTPRFSHTATALPDGRVLVAGGASYEVERVVALASAEIFDPATGTWTPTQSMDQDRSLHTATPIGDKVLVVGGFATNSLLGEVESLPRGDDSHPGEPLTSVELYDPATGTWSPRGGLQEGRFSHTATRLPDGAVIVAGGVGVGGVSSSSEQYAADGDNGRGAWEAGLMSAPHAGHSATLLADGTVMVAGNAPPFVGSPYPSASTADAEVYDPAARRWSRTVRMGGIRGNHTATPLSNDRCRGAIPPSWCGEVLVAGGFDFPSSSRFSEAVPIAATEIYVPAPHVATVTPPVRAAGRPTEVVLEGSGFAGATSVSFGKIPISGFHIDSATRITATAPGGASPTVVEVSVVGPGGTSERLTPQPWARFTSYGLPAAIDRLVATATSPTSVDLAWERPSDGGDGLANEYVIAQDGNVLCGGRCTPDPARAFAVTDLRPSTTYRYSVAAVNAAGVVGPASEVEVTTLPIQGLDGAGACAPATVGGGQVELAGGRYHLIGVPSGTAVASDSPLYGWFDQGAGGAYQTTATPEAGRGYWSFGFCDRLVSLATGGPTSMSLPLGAYHASMVGNPSASSPATVSGADFSARWDPEANGGAGAYTISGYQQPITLGVGEGSWLFSYVRTEARIDAQG